MAVWWPTWPIVLCLICAWSAMGAELGLGALWVTAGGVFFGWRGGCHFWGPSRRASLCLDLACFGVLGLDSCWGEGVTQFLG